MDAECPKAGGSGDSAAFLFGGLALAQRGDAFGYLVGRQVFYVGGDGPLVVVGVGDAGEAVAVELVGGLGDGLGAGGFLSRGAWCSG